MDTVNRPRIMLAGTNSGVGKTMITTGLLAYFHEQGLKVQPFKVGPDYIDPGFHKKASGRSSYNLDTWMTPPSLLGEIFSDMSDDADLSIIEGVMGLYDGGENGISSSADIAKRLKIPVILVLDCSSVGSSIAATALGFRNYDKDVSIAGVILNKLGSSRHEALIRSAMKGIRMPVLGALRRDQLLKTPERHLGLTPVTEVETKALIHRLAEICGQCIDTKEIKRIADSAQALSFEREPAPKHQYSVRIGVAWDDAFNFYYPNSLKALEKRGADLVYFSPLHDRNVPNVDGMIIGGGFPEMFLQKLSENYEMIDSIKKAASDGMPIYAECGGLMYLCRSIKGFDGTVIPMAQLVPADIAMEKKLQRVGYVTGTAQRPSILADTGNILKGHEFHFSTIHPSADFPWAYQLQGSRQRTPHADGFANRNILATYLHISFAGNPKAGDHFLAVCEKYKETKKTD